jgi:hypothetical protein
VTSGAARIVIRSSWQPQGRLSPGRVSSLSSGGARPIQELQQLVGCQLDLLVAPLGCPVVAGDQAGPVEAAEVAVDEGVPRLGLLRGSLGEAEMPLAVLVPGVRLQEPVLVFGLRLDISPVARQDVLASTDEAAGARERMFIDRVRGQG